MAVSHRGALHDHANQAEWHSLDQLRRCFQSRQVLELSLLIGGPLRLGGNDCAATPGEASMVWCMSMRFSASFVSFSVPLGDSCEATRLPTKAIYRTIHVVALLLVLTLPGCQKRSPVIVEVVVETPGFNAAQMDEFVAQQLLDVARGPDSITDGQALSYGGRTCVYVEISGEQGRTWIETLIPIVMKALPGGSRLRSIRQLADGETIPIPDDGETDSLHIQIDRDAVRAAGIPFREFIDELNRLLPADVRRDTDPDVLAALPIAIGDREHRLGEFVDLTRIKVPICVVRKE